MAYSAAVYEKAVNELKARRQNAENSARTRHEEVAEKHPELLYIESEMAKTGLSAIKALGMGENAGEYIEKLKNKSLAVQEQRKALLRAAGYPEDYLCSRYTCPICRDKGNVDGKRCTCLKKLLRDIAYKELNMSAPLNRSGFELFDLSFYPEELRTHMQGIADFCKSYAEDFSQGSGSLFMRGATGLGKTHLSLAIAKEAVNKGYGVIYGSAQNLLTKIERERFGRSEDVNTEQLLIDCDLLILDDLGTEFSTQFTAAVIYNVLNSRIHSARPTIINTNLTLHELEEKYSQRIVSRILGEYTRLEFYGKDIRMLRNS